MATELAAAEQKLHPHRHHRHGWWWKTLIAGFILWAITIVVTAVTRNVNLIPTLILLGSFLVPFAVVLFAVERVKGSVSTLQLVLAFFVGGICGVLGASLLESNLHQSVWMFVVVGFIEEFVKGAIVVIVGWRVVPKTATQGALLGATIGAGFAAFESAGYAFNAAITSQGIDLVSLLHTEVLRAILSPVGHVLWTGLLGAVVFGLAKQRPRFRWSFLILAAYATIALLHALWDSTSELASYLALFLTGNATAVLEHGFLPQGTADAVNTLATVFYIIGLAVDAIIGVLILILVLRHYRRAERLHAAEATWDDPDTAWWTH
ncbi:PrsW family intramembrane metalloprotease [Frondihabitans australicus]|uniref:RsiW-degrading membrane proteinase PrsW (M82 family) n=1 Tax=Frondihabitans australicus TaxID=386892 RepID=A0A495IK40_9MICO|nr:PrsW family glutamic-type intramembrane protease [Frondihabitans australicus]RKR76344.1 RsiW-degrading membrane proteinase PrsW (M82 family) [Frondihabitans australicus]